MTSNCIFQIKIKALNNDKEFPLVAGVLISADVRVYKKCERQHYYRLLYKVPEPIS